MVVVSLFQVLFVLGTLLIAMSLQLDRRGVWNMMGPCLFALLIMVTAWVSEGRTCCPLLPMGNGGGGADPRLQPIQAWLETLKHPGGGAGQEIHLPALQ